MEIDRHLSYISTSIRMNYIQKIKYLYRARRYRHLLDRPEIAFTLSNLHDNHCALDIGAHKGAYTYWMHKAVGPNGRVFAFEPQIELADYLKRMIIIMGMENVIVEHLAISSNVGHSILTIPGDSPSPGATLESGLVNNESNSYRVPLTTIDSYFSNKPEFVINFIKCDVEGHELDVFKGAENTLTKFHPNLIFECEQRHHKSDSIHDVFAYLHNLGYKGYFFQKGHIHQLGEFNYEQGINDPEYVNNFLFSQVNII